jgi:hypothetical protein
MTEKRELMICRFANEDCPADCAHREPHAEIVDDDFGEHSPCIVANECDYCSIPTYCVSTSAPDLLAEVERLRPALEDSYGIMRAAQSALLEHGAGPNTNDILGLLGEIIPAAYTALAAGKDERSE